MFPKSPRPNELFILQLFISFASVLRSLPPCPAWRWKEGENLEERARVEGVRGPVGRPGLDEALQPARGFGA